MARIVVIGARRRRQGTGEFIARSLAAAGAEIAAVAGTSPESARRAQRDLAARYGISCRAAPDARSAIEAARPDVVAICTPYEHHRDYLELAAAAGADCLCEKPLWWNDAPDRRTETARIADAFRLRGRTLALVTQWPMTLPAYFSLWPEVADEPVERFEMWMCPMFPGPRMILDAVPHVVSLLQARPGPGRAADPRAEFPDSDRTRLELSFTWRHARGEVDVRCHLTVMERPPRPAAYAINGRRVDREIELPEYTMRLAAGDRRVAIEDPLDLLCRDFLLRAGYPDPAGPRTGAPEPVDREGLVEGIATLELLTRAAKS